MASQLRLIKIVVVASAIVHASVHRVVAQDAAVPSPPLTRNPSSGDAGIVAQAGLADFFTSRTPYEFWLAVLAAVTGMFIISLIAWSVSRMAHVRPEDITRPAIVITIITSALILIIAGFSNEQIAAAFGLFGTIVGYMLGRMSGPPSGPHAAEPSDQRPGAVPPYQTAEPTDQPASAGNPPGL